MKTIFNLKQYVVLLIAAFAMTSCLGNDDENFQIEGGGYIIQTGETSYFPMVTVIANEAMSGGCKVTNEKVSVSLKDVEGYDKMVIQTDPNTQSMLGKALTDVTGQYTITAVNAAGETASNWFSLSASKGMTALKSKIKVSGETITAYFQLAENADYYYIFVQKNSYDYSKYASKYWSETELKATTKETEGEYAGYYKLTVSMTDLLGTSTKLTAGSYKLVTAAAITQSTYGNFVVLQEGGQTSYVQE